MKLPRNLLTFVTLLFGFVGGISQARAQATLTGIGHLNTSGSAQGVTVFGNNLYLANFFNGLYIYDVTAPASPIFLSNTNNSAVVGYANAVSVLGNYAYLANEDDGLRIYDVTNPSTPTNVGYVSDTNINNGYASGIVAINQLGIGSRAFLANGFDGLRIYNLSSPTNPVLTGVASNGAYANGVAISGTYAYVADSAGGLNVYSFSSPGNPVLVSSTNNSGSANGIAIGGSYAYLANGSDGLRVYDISNPAHPVNVGHTNNGGSAQSVVISGSFAFVANYNDGLRIYDVSVPSHPVNVGSVATNGGTAYSVAVSGNYVYLANGSDGVRIYSVSLPAVAPSLNIAFTSTNTVLISWPVPSTGYTLKQNANIQTTNWTAVANVPVTNGNFKQVAIPLPPGSKFYRLSSP